MEKNNHIKKINNLDLHTFGNSKASINLVKILNDINFSSRKISAIYAKFNHTLYELEKIDSKTRIGLARMLFMNYKNNCFRDYPEIIKTHSLNVLCMYFKIWLEKQNANKPYKQRKK